MNRCEEESSAVAIKEFRSAGWKAEIERGGRHLIVRAITPSGAEYRMPIASTCSGGVGFAKKIAKWEARKIVRRAT